jgi:hypothetical protein
MDRINYGMESAICEIDRLLEAVADKPEFEGDQRYLLDIRQRLVVISRGLSPYGENFAAIAAEAEVMEDKIAQIADALFPYDEARVSGLNLARYDLEEPA